MTKHLTDGYPKTKEGHIRTCIAPRRL